MSNTPRTDACAFWARTAGVFGSNLESEFADDVKHVTAAFGPATDWYVVPVSAARKLERELAALKAQCEKLRAFANKIMDCMVR